MRLFIGVDVSIECANELRQSAAEIREAATTTLSWVPPSRYHVTLCYLGWTRPDVAYAVRDRVAPIAARTRELRFGLDQWGGFPSLEKARVLWVGVSDDGALERLAAEIETAVAELGFSSPKRPFHGHVTLARTRGKEVADFREVVVGSERKYSTSRVRSIKLFESDTNSDGYGYPVRHQWPLKSSKRHRSGLEQRDN